MAMVTTLVDVGVIFVAILHFWFFILETLLWQKKQGLKIFRLEREFARQTAALAANQGLYNAFFRGRVDMESVSQ